MKKLSDRFKHVIKNKNITDTQDTSPFYNLYPNPGKLKFISTRKKKKKKISLFFFFCLNFFYFILIVFPVHHVTQVTD